MSRHVTSGVVFRVSGGRESWVRAGVTRRFTTTNTGNPTCRESVVRRQIIPCEMTTFDVTGRRSAAGRAQIDIEHYFIIHVGFDSVSQKRFVRGKMKSVLKIGFRITKNPYN